MVTIVSAAFYGLISFDISSDQIGFEGGIGFAFIAFGYILLLWFLAKRKYLENIFSGSFIALFAPSIIGHSSSTKIEIECLELATATTVSNPMAVNELAQELNEK
jgi:hypothetical protein